MIAFEEFDKIPRLNRSMVVTEKIDGSNAAIIIELMEPGDEPGIGSVAAGEYLMAAQSRKRLIAPGKATDMAGFAGWVHENAQELANLLGPGRHFGEWYGHGIQRSYGLDHKRFALFNTERWGPTFAQGDQDIAVPLFMGEHAIHTVPVLERTAFSTVRIRDHVDSLREYGSRVPGAEGFAAEGVVVWHNAARQMFKVTTQGDERPKSSREPT